MSDIPPPVATPPHPLQAQIDDPAITAGHAAELCMEKLGELYEQFQEQGCGVPSELMNAITNIRQTVFWMRELAETLTSVARARANPGIVIAQDLPPTHLEL